MTFHQNGNGVMTVFPVISGADLPECDSSDKGTIIKNGTTKGVETIGPSSMGSMVNIVSSDADSSVPSDKQERTLHTALQVAVPFFIAGAGTIGAGLMLGRIQYWPVFEEVSQLFILVPALLGLKGNLDMCLASRLSTQANLGNMVTARDIWGQIIGNVALVQVQAIVAAFLVALFALTIGAIIDGFFDYKHALLLAAASVVTATTSCFVLDFVMIGVILISRWYHVNPDNVSTPLAASFGDVVSITVLANIASLLYTYHEKLYWVMILIVVFYLMVLPLWIFVVIKIKHTKRVLSSGWIPVLSALLISGLGGLVLDFVARIYPGFVVFQPIINGIGGNLVSVQASRTSTLLHQTSILGTQPTDGSTCLSPWRALLWGSSSAKTSRILLGMAIPGHLLFAFLADYIYSGKSTVTFLFMGSYLFVSLMQVSILLYTANVMVHFLWRRKIDPDNCAIPYLTALGDLIGSSFLALAFWFLHSIGQEIYNRA